MAVIIALSKRNESSSREKLSTESNLRQPAGVDDKIALTAQDKSSSSGSTWAD